MYFHDTINGKYIDMRCVTTDDAKFIVDLRNDNSLNKYVHAVSKDVELQVEWIRKQISRDNDYYFIYSDKSGKPAGLCSIYDIDENLQTADFGRWISWGNAAENVEAVILSFDFAFENNVKTIYLDMISDNVKVIKFWKRFGAKYDRDLVVDDMHLSRYIVTVDMYNSELRRKNTKLLKY